MKTPLLILLTSIATLCAQNPQTRPGMAPAGTPSTSGAPGITAPGAPAAGDPFVKGQPNDHDHDESAPSEHKEIDGATYETALEYFDISREDFLVLLDSQQDDAARYKTLGDWLKTGRTKQADFIVISGKNGNRSVVESIDETRYPIEFQRPRTEDDVAFPTTFETRNAGQTFEYELMVAPDNERVHMQLAPSTTQLLKFTDDVVAPGRTGAVTSHPQFISRKLSAAITAKLNQPRMIGTMSAPTEDGDSSAQTRLAFVTVRPASPQKPQPPKASVDDSGLIRLEYTFFSLERAAARELWLAQPDSQQCYDTLRGYVAANKARLEYINLNVTNSGSRTVSEAILEWQYGEEYFGPEVPGRANEPQDAKPESGKQNKSNTINTVSNPVQLPQGDWPKKAPIPPVAAAFETRNTGFTSEVEPVMGPDGVTVDIQYAAQFVKNKGPIEYTGIGKNYPQQPLFETRKISSSITAIVGRQQLLGTFNLPNESGVNGRKDDGRVWLGFLRVVRVK